MKMRSWLQIKYPADIRTLNLKDGFNQRSNQEAKANAKHDATTTVLHGRDVVVQVHWPCMYLEFVLV